MKITYFHEGTDIFNECLPVHIDSSESKNSDTVNDLIFGEFGYNRGSS